ncbi:hypothetical protein [Anaerolinea sp.]|uniref:hypothetical protein n=1 Tax=Anaerolinea sp. TaxID=1872519 RepID=UPI002ACD7582|nr:hypothetical protein [Anaerolinea sp.]
MSVSSIDPLYPRSSAVPVHGNQRIHRDEYVQPVRLPQPVQYRRSIAEFHPLCHDPCSTHA